MTAADQRTLTELLAGHFSEAPGSLDGRRAISEHLSNVYKYLIGFIQRPPELQTTNKSSSWAILVRVAEDVSIASL